VPAQQAGRGVPRIRRHPPVDGRGRSSAAPSAFGVRPPLSVAGRLGSV